VPDPIVHAMPVLRTDARVFDVRSVRSIGVADLCAVNQQRVVLIIVMGMRSEAVCRGVEL